MKAGGLSVYVLECFNLKCFLILTKESGENGSSSFPRGHIRGQLHLFIFNSFS